MESRFRIRASPAKLGRELGEVGDAAIRGCRLCLGGKKEKDQLAKGGPSISGTVSAAAQRDRGHRAEGTHLLSSGGRPQQTAGFRENEAAGWEKVHEVYRVHPDKQASQPSDSASQPTQQGNCGAEHGSRVPSPSSLRTCACRSRRTCAVDAANKNAPEPCLSPRTKQAMEAKPANTLHASLANRGLAPFPGRCGRR